MDFSYTLETFVKTLSGIPVTLGIMVVSILYQSLGGNFAIVNVFLPNGGLNNNAMVMGLYVYLYGTSRSRVAFSYAAAIVMLFISATVSLAVKALMNKLGRRFA